MFELEQLSIDWFSPAHIDTLGRAADYKCDTLHRIMTSVNVLSIDFLNFVWVCERIEIPNNRRSNEQNKE